MPRSKTASSPTSGGIQRLPVNPRRHKVPQDQRKRVATACNNCNVRRIKCSGETPCKQCSAYSRECQYPAVVEKVTIPRLELESLKAKCAVLERCLEEAVPDETRRIQLIQACSQASSASGSPEPNPNSNAIPDPYSLRQPQSESSSHPLAHPHVIHSNSNNQTNSTPVGLNSPIDSSRDDGVEDGRLLQDREGIARFLGGTSGATFLDDLKRFMSTILPLAHNGPVGQDMQYPGSGFLSSVGIYQTFDSQPLWPPSNDINPLWLPSPNEMSIKLQQLRFFIQEGVSVSGGVLFWGDLTSIPASPSSSSNQADYGAHRHLAFHHAAFAYASLFGLTTANSKNPGQLGELFFERARMLLGNPLDVATFTYSCHDIAAMALIALYMIDMNRRDTAYMYITTAMRISIVHGINRFSKNENEKRVFWTVYIIDRWVSCMMGRPPTLLDEFIKLDLPCEKPGLPTCIGLLANIELSRIVGRIICNTYQDKPNTWSKQGAPARNSHHQKTVDMLSEWVQGLPPQLHMSYETFSQDRPLCTLHMNYNQLLILTIRPLFLAAVKKAVADRFVRWQDQQNQQQSQQSHSRMPSSSIDDHPHTSLFRQCSDAARRNLRLGRWLCKITPGEKLMVWDMHAIFNAAIVLMLHQIVFVNLRTGDVSDIVFAMEAFAREADANDAYAADCLKVMQDLHRLVQKLRALMFEGVPHVTPSHPHLAPTSESLTPMTMTPIPTSGTLPVSMSMSGPIPVSMSMSMPMQQLLSGSGLESPTHQHTQQQQQQQQQQHQLRGVSMGPTAPMTMAPYLPVVTSGTDVSHMILGQAVIQELMNWSYDNADPELAGWYARSY